MLSYRQRGGVESVSARRNDECDVFAGRGSFVQLDQALPRKIEEFGRISVMKYVGAFGILDRRCERDQFLDVFGLQAFEDAALPQRIQIWHS